MEGEDKEANEVPRVLCLALVSCFSSGPTEVPGPVCHKDQLIARETLGSRGCAHMASFKTMHESLQSREDSGHCHRVKGCGVCLYVVGGWIQPDKGARPRVEKER